MELAPPFNPLTLSWLRLAPWRGTAFRVSWKPAVPNDYFTALCFSDSLVHTDPNFKPSRSARSGSQTVFTPCILRFYANQFIPNPLFVLLYGIWSCAHPKRPLPIPFHSTVLRPGVSPFPLVSSRSPHKLLPSSNLFHVNTLLQTHIPVLQCAQLSWGHSSD